MIFHPSTKIFFGEYLITKTNYNALLPVIATSENEWIRDIALFLQYYLSSSQVIIVSTSGTTGLPKKMSFMKSKMRNSAAMTGSYFSLVPGTTAVLSLPVTYIAGKMMIVRALTLGLILYIVEPTSDPFKYNQLPGIIGFMPLVPLQLQTILANPASAKKLNTVNKILLGGASLDFSLHQSLKQLSNEVFEGFGMTETLSHVAVRNINNKDEDIPPFYALPGVSFTLDVRGCLVIHAPEIIDLPVFTNDVAELLSEGSFLWKGRIDNVINSGGIKIYPEYLENYLAGWIHCTFCIVPLPDKRLGEKLVLVLESDNPNILNGTLFINSLKEKMDFYQIPKAIKLMPCFPRNSNGKVLRHKIIEYIASNHPDITGIYP